MAAGQPAEAPDGSRARTAAAELARYLRTETVGGLILLGAAGLALLLANSPWAAGYARLRSYPIGPAAMHLQLSLGDWAADGLLAVFFYVAGLELKRELIVGELSELRAAVLPVVAALGGMLVPAALAAVTLHGAPGGGTAWAIPVATDIAFALGVLALTGSGMPPGARVFLLSLAVVDDLGAITLIGVFFTTRLSLLALGVAAVLCGLFAVAQQRRITSPWLYAPLAVAVWVAVHASGVHATVAGIVLGLLTRVRPDDGEAEAPAVRMEHLLQPWSAGLAVPVFALFAAGVPLGGRLLAGIGSDRLMLSVIIGLVLGKLAGITGFAAIAVRLRIATRPSGLAWRDILAVSILGGVGFTVSLLIAELALTGPAADRAKAAVLLASALAAVLGAALLTRRSRTHRAARTR